MHAIRVGPGEELKSKLMAFVAERQLSAAAVVTCCGSLDRATLRLANASKDSAEDEDVLYMKERMEILSLVGTMSANDGGHLHISLGDKDGNVVGGHCVGDMNVFTTAEVVIAEIVGANFHRNFDSDTGYKELCVTSR
mmetsp:Transcript_36361/g.69773  ORF Transcript_36361/g.69773 Transcript_36361/m.69773 type:complete len:138 (+) Transcript_36361:1185-1598(+)